LFFSYLINLPFVVISFTQKPANIGYSSISGKRDISDASVVLDLLLISFVLYKAYPLFLIVKLSNAINGNFM